MENRAKKILKEAIDIFQKTTGLDVDYQINHYRDLGRPDGEIRIAHQNLELYFAIDVKLRITPATIGIVTQELLNNRVKGLLITRYATPQIAELLKEMDIPFIDTAGNAYINKPPLFIYITGNKPKGPYKEPLQRAFKPGGLRVIFVLLCIPGMENKPYREIAEAANVALGTVGWVVKELKMTGYLMDMGRRGRKLVRKDNLLKRWVTAYPEQLRPKEQKGRFRAMDDDWWKNVEIKHHGAYWGGEVAAAILTNYLKPATVTIYTNKPIGKLLLKNKLKRVHEGNIEIFNVFWGFKHNGYYDDIVHPILIYADLLATGDIRNIETARIIYEKELARFVRED